MSEKLMPCPFCGGDAFEGTANSPYGHRMSTNGTPWRTIACKACGFHFSQEEFRGPSGRQKLYEKWNTRAGEEPRKYA